MNLLQADKFQSEIFKLCERTPGVWVTISRELRPELRMIRVEISVKVDDKE